MLFVTMLHDQKQELRTELNFVLVESNVEEKKKNLSMNKKHMLLSKMQ